MNQNPNLSTLLEEGPVDLTPNPWLLRGFQNDRQSLYEGINELVDNALDAGATDIVVEIDQEKIEVRDNGSGCDSMRAMVSMGEHKKANPDIEETSGVYGQGLVTSAIVLGRYLDIETIHGKSDRVKRTIRIDWTRQSESESWEGPKPIIERSEQSTGTIIRITKLRNLRVNRSVVDRIREHLSREFTPAMEHGVQIVVNDIAITPLKFPRLHDVIVEEGIFQGKRFKMMAGRFRVPDRKLCGFWVLSGHRFICQREWEPCKTNQSSSFHARLELYNDHRSWDRERQKRGFKELDAFSDFIFPTIEPLLKKLEEETQEVLLDNICNMLAVSTAAALGFRATRKPRENHTGTVRPVHTGRRHRKAKRLQPGGDMKGDDKTTDEINPGGKNAGTFIRYKMEHHGETSDLLDIRVAKRTCTIAFNQDSPWIQSNLNNLMCLRSTAVHAFFADSILKPELYKQMKLFVINDEETYLQQITRAFNQVALKLNTEQ